MLNKFLPVFFLAFSGLLITTVSAFFSVQGFLLFIPDPHLMIGILGLGIAFELAKITASTFLFHKMSDSNFPGLFKLILTSSVLALIIFSSIFTFVHLNSSASKSLANSSVSNIKIERLQERNITIEKTIKDFEDQISSMQSNMVTAKMKLYDKFKPEKEKLQKEYESNVNEIHSLQDSAIESDQFVFLTNLSKFTGLEREKIFTVVILFIVCIIDPLAISLFLAASYIMATIRPKQVVLEESKQVKKSNTVDPEIDIKSLFLTGNNDLYKSSVLPESKPTYYSFPKKLEPKVVTIEVPVEVEKEIIKEVEVPVEVIKEVYIEKSPPVNETFNQYDNPLIMNEYKNNNFSYVPKNKTVLDNKAEENFVTDEQLDAVIDKILEGDNPLGHRKKILIKK